MKIDFVDLRILQILSQENLTAYSLAQKFFPNSDIRGFGDKSQALKSRLKKLEKYNLVEKITDKNKNYYKTKEEAVIFLERLRVPIKRKNILILPDVFLIKNQNKWNIYQF